MLSWDPGGHFSNRLIPSWLQKQASYKLIIGEAYLITGLHSPLTEFLEEGLFGWLIVSPVNLMLVRDDYGSVIAFVSEQMLVHTGRAYGN